MSELKNLSAILEGGAVPGRLLTGKQSANCLRHTSNWKTAK